MDHENLTPQFHEEEDDSPEAIAERMRVLYGIERTGFDELIELSKNEPGSERFEVFLDDLTYEALDADVDFKANGEKMASGKLSPEEQEDLRDTQRAIFDAYRQSIAEEAGLSTEAGLSDVEKSKQNILSILHETLGDVESPEPPRVLEALGIISHDEDGKEIFTYPHGLFPRATDRKWETYIESVKNHKRIERAVEHDLADRTELEDADHTRRLAHNAAARDVQNVLGLDKLTGGNWDFEKTRNMLAKMRDSKFPTVETAEKALTEEAVVEGVIGVGALKVLRTRLSDMHK